jgi:hypothetical protein
MPAVSPRRAVSPIASFLCRQWYVSISLKIRDDVKNRPLYVVQDEFHSNTVMAGSEGRNVVAHADDAQSIWSLAKPRTAA